MTIWQNLLPSRQGARRRPKQKNFRFLATTAKYSGAPESRIRQQHIERQILLSKCNSSRALHTLGRRRPPRSKAMTRRSRPILPATGPYYRWGQWVINRSLSNRSLKLKYRERSSDWRRIQKFISSMYHTLSHSSQRWRSRLSSLTCHSSSRARRKDGLWCIHRCTERSRCNSGPINWSQDPSCQPSSCKTWLRGSSWSQQARTRISKRRSRS